MRFFGHKPTKDLILASIRPQKLQQLLQQIHWPTSSLFILYIVKDPPVLGCRNNGFQWAIDLGKLIIGHLG